MVDTLPLPKSPSFSPAARATIVAGLFWVFTYAVLTTRASMIYGDAFTLTNERRLVALTAGAAIFWAVLKNMIFRPQSGARHPALIVATVLPAALAVLATRYVMDWAVFQDIRPFRESLLWVLVWAGYFGLGISGILAFEIHSGRFGPAAPRTAVAAVPAERAAPVAQVAPARRSTVEDWDWLINALATEMVDLPPAERVALSRRLLARAGYELADDDDPSAAAHNARLQLAGRVAARLSARP